MEHSRPKVSASGDRFEKDGKPFFLLSDTDWMAFHKLSLEEWEDLIRLRAEQGFNALQLSVLPIAHDNSEGQGASEPFAKLPDGAYDFSKINGNYFDKAENMLEALCAHGLIPFLHLFWVNYIPDTWAAKRSPGTVIPFERLEPITREIIGRFRRFQPIYSVSGDTNFETEAVVRYYQKILDILHELDPEGLTTLHLQPGADPPQALRTHPQYHFYAYQSGHGVGMIGDDGGKHSDQNAMLVFSRQFLEKPERKPIVNTEPCYEGHGFGCTYGRFRAFDVRRAAWLSILSGAKAGLTYGAHGVWQFHRSGDRFNNVSFSSMPYDWRTAMRLPGAWDYGMAKWLVESYGLAEAEPANFVLGRTQPVACAQTPGGGTIAVYAPYNDDIVLDTDLSGYRVEAFDLDARCPVYPRVTTADGRAILQMTGCNHDILFIARRKDGKGREEASCRIGN